MTGLPKFLFFVTVASVIGCTPSIRFKPGEIPTPHDSDPQDVAQARFARESIMAEAPILREPQAEARVSRIMQRLLQVTPSTGHWTVTLLDDPTFNAMATPGNYIYVFKGMLDALRSDDEVATVLAHEIGHRLAVHEQKAEGEALGEALAALTTIALGVAVAVQETSTQQDVEDTVQAAQALGEGFTTLRYSKDKEREADLIGIFLMADARYNPEAAAQVWASRYAEGGGQTHDFFSTHPLHEDRYTMAMELLPQARQRYQQALKRGSAQTAPVEVKEPSPQLDFEVSQAEQALEQDDLDLAESIASSLTRRDPTFAQGYNVLGIAKLKRGKTREAGHEFAKALKLEPSNPTLIYNSACVRALNGESSEALKLLEKSFSLDPSLVSTAEQDSDLQSLADLPSFKALLAREYTLQPPQNIGGNTLSIN